MSEQTQRLIEPDEPPESEQLRVWMGEGYRYWTAVTAMIERNYPGVFDPNWQFGGKKHGWSLRYKKSKSFCTLIPENGCFAMLIVFGGAEREKLDTIRGEISEAMLAAYDSATTYHDGKWFFFAVDNDDTVRDVERLLAVKRRPIGAARK
ncbi:MAG: DUF3788 domain-containing protein [Spirochaetaceae bacterium]|nr:MAG: DUF3788 domain-containing protein [Spirochaetaceae bacterium]